LWRKVLGSGREGGFGLNPGLDRGGLFCVFSDEELGREWLAHSDTLMQYRRHSVEWFAACLQPVSARGSWSGHTLPAEEASPLQPEERLAALTRASIKPSTAARFWRHAPPAEHDLAAAAGCRLAVGLGEAPLLRQATFSIWDNTAAMDAYARSGAHLTAIRNAYQGAYFSESMFVRFRVLHTEGSWRGQSWSNLIDSGLTDESPAQSRGTAMQSGHPQSAA
jgi:spheroidene monooxygenase